MHVLQYIAIKASDEHAATQNVRMDLEDREDHWYDWFDEDGGRWSATEKPISFAAEPQKFVDKFAWLMNQRQTELDDLVKRLGDTGYDLQDLILLYDPLKPLTTDKANALYGLTKIVKLLFMEWDYNSGFYDLENDSAAPFDVAEVINTCNTDTTTGVDSDDDETWWLVPVDFHF
jgi:hypothetical protein